MSESRRGAGRTSGGASRGRQSGFFRGEDGMRRTEEELEIQKQRAEQRKAQNDKPFRYYTKVGKTQQIIICDDKPDFFMYEHAMKDAEGNWGRLFTGCTKTFDNCPACEALGRESYYGMYLTVIDLTPFTTRDGDTVDFSRKLLVVKPAQQKKFLRFYAKEGTLRGAVFDMTRDSDKDPSIGNDIEFVEFAPEDELETYTRSWKDREGKRHEEICHEPYNYEEIFDAPDSDAIRAIVGGEPPPGSREGDRRAIEGRGSSRGAARGSSSRGTSRSADRDDPPARGRGRGRAASSDDWSDAEDNSSYGDAAGESPTRRGRGGASRGGDDADADPPARSRDRAAPSRGRSSDDADGDGSDADDPPFDADPPRGRGRSARGGEADDPPARRRGRGTDPDPEPEPPRRPVSRTRR